MLTRFILMVFMGSGGHNKYCTLVAYITQTKLLTVLEARSPRSRCWQGWLPLSLSLWFAESHSLAASSHGLFFTPEDRWYLFRFLYGNGS